MKTMSRLFMYGKPLGGEIEQLMMMLQIFHQEEVA